MEMTGLLFVIILELTCSCLLTHPVTQRNILYFTVLDSPELVVYDRAVQYSICKIE